jgi:AI-2 transport protein TqsA
LEDKKLLNLAIAVIVVFLAGVTLKVARPILFPFFLALFLSYIIEPVAGFLVRLKVPRKVAQSVVILALFILLYVLGLLLYTSGKSFAAELPKYGQRIIDLARRLESGSFGVPVKLRIASYLEQVELKTIASLVVTGLGPVLSFLWKLVLLFLFLVFIVAGRGRLAGKLRAGVDPEQAEKVLAATGTIDASVRKYLVIKTVMGLINGFTVWFVLTLFGVDFALIFGFLAFALNYIPSVGSIIATVLRVVFAFFQLGTIWGPLWILIITTGADTVMGNVVEPRVMGKGLGLSPLVVIFSLLLWGWLWGIPGMVLAVPIMSGVKIVCENVPGLKPVAILIGP